MSCIRGKTIYSSILQKTCLWKRLVYNKIMSTNYLKLETIVKGFANRRRLEMLEFLKKEPGLSVENISHRLNIGYENTSDHIRKLSIAGLVTKHTQGTSVIHRLTPRATSILVFCKKLK